MTSFPTHRPNQKKNHLRSREQTNMFFFFSSVRIYYEKKFSRVRRTRNGISNSSFGFPPQFCRENNDAICKIVGKMNGKSGCLMTCIMCRPKLANICDKFLYKCLIL